MLSRVCCRCIASENNLADIGLLGQQCLEGGERKSAVVTDKTHAVFAIVVVTVIAGEVLHL